MTEFTAAERQFLKDLATNPLWQSVLDKIVDYDLPRYKPGDDPPDVQNADWHFRSGVDRGRKDVVTLLTE